MIVQIQSLERLNTDLCQIPTCSWTFSSALLRASQQGSCKQSRVFRRLGTTLCSEMHYSMDFHYYDVGALSIASLIFPIHCLTPPCLSDLQ